MRILNPQEKNEKGIVFVTVLLIILVMTIVSLSMISMALNQSMTTESEVKRIQSELLALGILAYTFAEQRLASPQDNLSFTEPLESASFDITSDITRSGAGPDNTDPLIIDVSY